MNSFLNKVISVFLVFLTCSLSPVMLYKKSIYQQKELISLSESGIGSEQDPVYLTAHRGVVSEAPENTLPAFQKAVEYNYYAAECDIRLSADNVWVLSHNEEINKRFWQFGNISDYTYAELSKFSYKDGCNFWKYDNLRIPTLDEYLDVFIGSSTRPEIEIKSENYDNLSYIIEALKSRGLENQAIIISFNYEQLKAIRKLDKNVEIWYLVQEITDEEINKIKAIGGKVMFSCNTKNTSTDEIKKSLNLGIGVAVWTVDSVEKAKELYDAGVRHIVTNILYK